MPVLHAVMEDCGHVTHDDIVVIADVLNLSVADVHGVVSFYEDFRTTPPPAHEVRVCRGEACQSVGAEGLFERATVEAVTASGDVHHSQVFCLGNCALGPSALVDGALHGRVTPERLAELTAGWRA
jgi:formate dehydrogenase subunit gamma